MTLKTTVVAPAVIWMVKGINDSVWLLVEAGAGMLSPEKLIIPNNLIIQ